MLIHKPLGLGHPYRTEPFERSPHFPVETDQVTFRVLADVETDSVRLVIRGDLGNKCFDLINHGPGRAIELGPFGKTAKEFANQSHLEDAAARSGEYGHMNEWALGISARDLSHPFTYWFESESEITGSFSCDLHTWQASATLEIKVNNPNINLNDIQFLRGSEGVIRRIKFSIPILSSERVVGFGERFNTVQQSNQLVDAVVYEEYKGQGERTYLPVPFFHAISSKFAAHIKSTTTTRYHIDQNSQCIQVEVDTFPGQTELEIDFFFGSPAETLFQYLQSVGLPEDVPSWVFSLWLSSNEWNTQKRVEEELKACFDSGIKPGVVVLEAWSDESTFTVFRDAEYEVTDGQHGLSSEDIKYPLNGAWPNPKSMINELHEKDVRLILWQIPVIKESTPANSQAERNWNFAIENKMVIREADGSPYRVRGFWFRDALLPDLTDSTVRKWWVDQRRYLVEQLGVDGFKTDGGEHAWGQDLIYLDGDLGLKKNNLFPVHYAQAFHELFKSLNRKGVTFSRAGFTGSQAFPAFWAGDENSTWQAFKASIRAGITASASGFFHWGWDIGGFSGDIPSPELYLRGTAMATFCPIMQIHSEYNHHRKPSNDRTPWNLARRYDDPKILSIFRKFTKIRNALIPYLEKSSRDAIRTGRPIMAGLFFDFPEDEKIWDFPYQYMLGDNLLIAPITDENQDSIEVYLPAGDWFDFWSGREYSGSRAHVVSADLESIPVFSKDRNLSYASLMSDSRLV